MRRSAHLEQVVLIVLGDGEKRESFEREARALLGDRLHMPGFVNQSQLGPYFVASDVFVMPSRRETWGLVVNEAMQFGLPVISGSHVGSHQDLVVEGETGMVFESENAADLVRCIDALVSQPEKTREMGEAAHRHVGLYSTEASARGILQAIGVA